MKKYVNQSVKYYGDSLKVLVLTGGECFLLKNDLAKIIEYGTSKGLITRVVTNGYWAKTYQDAYDILFNLRDKGLCEINFSTGDEHLEWVSYENIVNGCRASMDLGLTCLVNVEKHDNSVFQKKSLQKDVRLQTYFDETIYHKPLIVDSGIWIPFDKSSSFSYDDMRIQSNSNHKRCTSLFSTLPINPFSEMTSCCGLTCEHILPFRLGNLHNHNIKELYETQFSDLLKLWLFTEGPYTILKHIYEQQNIDEPITGHICYICAKIFQDAKNIQWMKDNYQKIMPNIILKYLLLKKTLN
ncbi:hypothetical protein FACS1894178_6410 [Bacteroidia bacterium]|nr:hypothetical protein FACS1894178_6410 [Bacteroidia bacterium]